MTGFIALAILMTVVALAWVLAPLARRAPAKSGIARAASNVALLRDQLAELDADLTRGVLTEELYRESRTELERRVIEESKSAEPAPASTSTGSRTPTHRGLIAALAVLLPAAAAGMYLWLGNPAGLSPQRVAAPHEVTRDQIEAMVAQLATRMEQAPNDPEGWDMLARSYTVLGHYDKAASAYERLVKIVPDNADAYANYADALAMASGQRLAGKPMELVRRALAIDPKHWKALALSGSDAFARKNYRAAADFWERSWMVLPPESPLRQSIAANVEEARKAGGIKTPSKIAAKTAPATSAIAGAGTNASANASTAGASVGGNVGLSPRLAARVSPDDTVFIFARAEGQRAPVAILRRKAGELPLNFTLDDGTTMMPGASLAAFGQLTIGARISKSGSAMPQPGDMEGFSAPVPPGTRGVAIVIDTVRN